MRFYRVELYSTANTGSLGMEWYTRKRKAQQAARRFLAERRAKGETPPFASAKIEVVDVEPTKAGILRALEDYASHPDNG